MKTFEIVGRDKGAYFLGVVCIGTGFRRNSQLVETTEPQGAMSYGVEVIREFFLPGLACGVQQRGNTYSHTTDI